MNEIVKPDSLIVAQAESLTETFFGGCPHDCPDTCSMLFDVKDGQLQGVRGNPDHPMTRGGLCVKLKDYEKRHYHPDRLLYPMKRVGPKGSKSSSASPGTRRWTPSSPAGRRSSTATARRPSRPTATSATKASCTG